MSRCLNCGAELTGDFCHNCGQRSSVCRLTVKSAIVDDTWSAVRMDRRVWPTVFALLIHPWVVIKEYIQGKRVRWTQPVRLIIILCFVDLVIEMFVPHADSLTVTPLAPGATPLQQLWHFLQVFYDESELTVDIIDSIVLAPIFVLLFRRWGSRRFNIAEYSTAYLYLAAASVALDIILIPFEKLMGDWIDFIIAPWWIYVFIQMVIHAFPSLKGWRRVLMLIGSILVCGVVLMIVHYLLEPA